MKNNKVKSLSSKIILSIVLVSLLIITTILTIFEKINKEAFYNIETEKVHIIAKTIEPLIALNIYLGLDDKINQLTTQLIKNPNILAVKVLIGNTVINEVKSKEYENNLEDSFIVKDTIFEPNSKKEMGFLILIYSSKNYQELLHKYTLFITALLIFLGVLFLVLGLYIKRLLSPLGEIATLLKNYSPDKEMEIPFIKSNNEIGLISGALTNMQESILKYSKQQQNINNYLEEEVSKKTAELVKQLYTNALTGLPNRLSLLNKIKNDDKGALLIINIDDFKEINDFYGHEVGDGILIEFSLRLQKMYNQNQNILLKHLSGDEFALFFIQKPSMEELMQIAKKLVNAVEKMIFFHENNEVSIRITIGGSYQIKGALEKADIALKSAKKKRKSYLIYDEKSNVEKLYKENMEWVRKLKKAMEQDKIVPYFQAIFDNQSNKIVSCECLIRLIDDEDNVIVPYKFLSIAKKSRLYSKLTKIMIEKSCRYFEHLDFDFSVNLSVEDILDLETVDYIKYNIKKYNVSNHIIFEILESEGIENYQEVSTFIDEMKTLGCRTAIDDFGSGYSNFEHLLKLNVDYIKIDGTLIKNLDTDKNAQVVVETIVEFARKLNIATIAEFVHSEAVLKKVKEFRVDRTQGFFLSEPQRQILLELHDKKTRQNSMDV